MRSFLHIRARLVLQVAILAILFAALSPAANIWRAKSQPGLFAEMCTSLGFAKVAIDGATTPTPAMPEKRAPHCAWCLASATWLALPGTTSIDFIQATGSNRSPVFFSQPPSLSRLHAFAWAQAPPPFPD